MKKLNNSVFLHRFIRILISLSLFVPCLLYAQQALTPQQIQQALKDTVYRNEQGKPISVTSKASYVLGQLIVHFKPGIITLPAGRKQLNLAGQPNMISQVTSNPKTAALLKRTGIQNLQQVYKNTEPGDTLRVLADGHRVRITDFSQVFLLTLPDSIEVLKAMYHFKKLSTVLYVQPN